EQEQQEEDRRDGCRHDDHEVTHGAFHVLELTTPFDVVAVGQLDLLVYLGLQFGDEAAEVAALDVDADHDAALAELARDLGGTVGDVDVGDVGKTRLRAGPRFEQDVGNGVDIVAEILRQTNHRPEASFTFENLGRLLAAHRGFDG